MSRACQDLLNKRECNRLVSLLLSKQVEIFDAEGKWFLKDHSRQSTVVCYNYSDLKLFTGLASAALIA
jgi:hypothetical protein